MENSRPENLLRKSTLTNAVFSTLSGVLIIVFNHPIVAFLGMPPTVSLAGLGVSLMVFAMFLLLNLRRSRMKLLDARIAVFLDFAWVVGSYALLFLAPLSSEGKWVLMIVADIVFCLAIFQLLGIRRVTRRHHSSFA